jgi:membrane protease YdiL (CAAX protease family)
MKNNDIRLYPLIISIVMAAIFWFISFRVPMGNFWIKIAVSASLLALFAFWCRDKNEVITRFDAMTILIGIASAIILYAVFWVGQTISQVIFPFAQHQIGSIYLTGKGTPIYVIVLLLFFITGPAEEIYWRGFLQNRLSRRFGGWQGWIISTGIYAGVHICTFNFMLVGAAAVAGLFWGLIFWRLNNLAPVIISHAVWSVVIFAVFPTM